MVCLTNLFISSNHCYANTSYFEVLSRRKLDVNLDIKDSGSSDCDGLHPDGIASTTLVCVDDSQTLIWFTWFPMSSPLAGILTSGNSRSPSCCFWNSPLFRHSLRSPTFSPIRSHDHVRITNNARVLGPETFSLASEDSFSLFNVSSILQHPTEQDLQLGSGSIYFTWFPPPDITQTMLTQLAELPALPN